LRRGLSQELELKQHSLKLLEERMQVRLAGWPECAAAPAAMKVAFVTYEL